MQTRMAAMQAYLKQITDLVVSLAEKKYRTAYDGVYRFSEGDIAFISRRIYPIIKPLNFTGEIASAAKELSADLALGLSIILNNEDLLPYLKKQCISCICLFSAKNVHAFIYLAKHFNLNQSNVKLIAQCLPEQALMCAKIIEIMESHYFNNTLNLTKLAQHLDKCNLILGGLRQYSRMRYGARYYTQSMFDCALADLGRSIKAEQNRQPIFSKISHWLTCFRSPSRQSKVEPIYEVKVPENRQ